MEGEDFRGGSHLRFPFKTNQPFPHFPPLITEKQLETTDLKVKFALKRAEKQECFKMKELRKLTVRISGVKSNDYIHFGV